MSIAELQKTSNFYAHRDKIEQEIAKSILSLGEKTKLRDACEYALKSGGKRFRPLLVLLVADALGNNLNVIDAALSVEFFHTASLIVDDLPCMDNEEERRSQPTLHKIYGESIALLSSYALICAAFEKIHTNTMKMRDSSYKDFADSAGMIALETATRCAGISGATGGQFYDIFPPNLTLETLRQVIYQKTVTLFEVSFVFGWLFGGGDSFRIEQIKKSAYHFGMAFQIADDLGDLAQDVKNQREINLAKHIGKERAYIVFEEELKHFKVTLMELGLDTPAFKKMCDMLEQLAARNFETL
ncbi:MAG TPA: polyprenyl synthetase family protein [Rhabdochlamydiaceae bacterium]|jgi:geranylgeranyl diphosphate synthase type II|nr:polyprenyl synthetase family protein [Rhabdochlamydiaceae bacterium]